MDLLKYLNNILSIRTHILIAVSGGLDSMVLLDIVQYTKLYISVVHINFQLRDKDSNVDESFIQDLCKYKKIPFYKKKINTKYYSIEKKKSLQMTARSLRYGWFFKILKDIDAKYIVLGHHLDDMIETFFINLFRSSSLKGLVSIPEFSKYLLRPLLPFNKKKILQFAKRNNIWWREDKSNQSNKFLRNIIRNNLITNFYNKNSKTIFFLKNDYIFIQKLIIIIFNKITINFVKKNFCWEINISKLKKIKPLNIYLNKLFSPYGFYNLFFFNKELKTLTGKYIFSKKYKLLFDRNRIIITHQQEKYSFNFKLFFEINDFMNQKALISIDFDRISWPIYLGVWKKGNIFIFYKKKISKLFKNFKLNIFEKKEIFILFNADNKIIWVINFILNFLFKITLKTNIILNIF